MTLFPFLWETAPKVALRAEAMLASVVARSKTSGAFVELVDDSDDASSDVDVEEERDRKVESAKERMVRAAVTGPPKMPPSAILAPLIAQARCRDSAPASTLKQTAAPFFPPSTNSLPVTNPTRDKHDRYD